MNGYRIGKCRYISDLSGMGAAKYPGRWNGKGTYVLYVASTPSLALLESVAHLGGIVTESYCMINLLVPDEGVTNIDSTQLPNGWNNYPSPEILRNIGDAFVRAGEHLALKVPSALIQEEYNLIVNPQHPLFKDVKIVSQRNIDIDTRLARPLGKA